MELALDWYYAVPLLFTALAVVLASLFVKLRSSAGDKGAESKAATAAKDAGEEEPPGLEAEASAAADRGDGREGARGGQEGGGEGPPRSEAGERVGEPARDRLLQEAAGAEGKKTDETPEQQRQGQGQGPGEDAASRTAKAGPPSPPPEMRLPSQAAAAAAAEEGEEPDDEDDDEEEVEEDEEESKEEDQESDTEKLVVREPESENVDEQFSFKYSPGKLRGNQYKTLLTKEELEEEQRTEDYMKLSLDSS